MSGPISKSEAYEAPASEPAAPSVRQLAIQIAKAAKKLNDLREGATSLKVFLDMCREDGVEPLKRYSGKLMVRLPTELHQRAAISAAATGKSLNAWLADVVAQASV